MLLIEKYLYSIFRYSYSVHLNIYLFEWVMIKLTGDSESVPSKFWVVAVEDDLSLSTASTDYNEVASNAERVDGRLVKYGMK